MKRLNLLFSLVLLIFLVASIYPTDASAIPAFARRYKISCTTCHSPIPRLKPYGEEFAANGFTIPENEKTRDYVSAGDDMLWLNKTFPIAIRFDAYAVYKDKQEIKSDLRAPWGIKFLSGGTLYKNIGYYFYFYLSERGEVAGMEDAYIHFNDVFNTSLDILVGQFQTSDPLMKRELRLTLEDYQIYRTKVGLSHTDLTYDRGVMLLYGIEKTGTDLAALIVNGNGKGAADENRNFDNDRYKNIGFRVKQSFGDFMSLGGFYYKGKEVLEDAGVMLENEVTYFGPDMTLSAGPFFLTVQYLQRKDTDAMAQIKDIETKGTVAELVYSPKLDRSRYYLTALFNNVENDYYKYRTATLSGTYLLSRNLRLILEFTRDIENEQNRFALGMVSGF